jgi:RNA polymerase sigma factor (sigma-70 family)
MTDAEFREAYAQHKDVLCRFVRRLTGSGVAAEDLVHDCFLLLWRNGTAYDRERGTLRSFLLGVTRNLAWKRLRSERTFDELEDDRIVGDPIDPVGRERGEMVEHAVAALPPLQREALILAEYEGMTLEEIARITGAEVAAVKSRLHRGRENLRRILAPLVETKGTVYGTQR